MYSLHAIHRLLCVCARLSTPLLPPMPHTPTLQRNKRHKLVHASLLFPSSPLPPLLPHHTHTPILSFALLLCRRHCLCRCSCVRLLLLKSAPSDWQRLLLLQRSSRHGAALWATFSTLDSFTASRCSLRTSCTGAPQATCTSLYDMYLCGLSVLVSDTLIHCAIR